MTAILVTLVGTMLVPVPADSYVHTAGLPRVEQLQVRQSRTANPKEQSRMAGYARRADESNRARPAESSSSAPETTDSGTSSYAKTQVRWAEGTAESGAHSPALALASPQAAANSDTQSVVAAVTGSLNNPSIATGEPLAPLGGAATSLAAIPNLGTGRCGFCARNECQWRDRRTGHRFRPVGSGLHANDLRPKTAGWHRTWVSRRPIAANNAQRTPTAAYSSF